MAKRVILTRPLGLGRVRRKEIYPWLLKERGRQGLGDRRRLQPPNANLVMCVLVICRFRTLPLSANSFSLAGGALKEWRKRMKLPWRPPYFGVSVPQTGPSGGLRMRLLPLQRPGFGPHTAPLQAWSWTEGRGKIRIRSPPVPPLGY